MKQVHITKPIVTTTKITDHELIQRRQITLEERVKRKWSKPADKLPIGIDLPRLIRHIDIRTPDGDVVLPRADAGICYEIFSQW